MLPRLVSSGGVGSMLSGDILFIAGILIMGINDVSSNGGALTVGASRVVSWDPFRSHCNGF